MVNSQNKGTRNELLARNLLREKTGHEWERVPKSGALHPKHKLKGDLYIPPVDDNIYCVEVKAYKDEQLNSSILTSVNSQIHKWWLQAITQAEAVDKKPLLLFKKDRGKWFIVHKEEPWNLLNYIYVRKGNFYISVLEEWLDDEEVEWTLKA